MSKSLESQVWKSNLKAELKPLAAVMADMGNDDGVGIYPSVEYLAWLLGRSERAVQVLLKELSKMSVATRIKNAKGGRGLTPQYYLDASKLPSRPSWAESRKGAESSPFVKGAESGQKGAVCDVKGAESAPDPLVRSVSKIRENGKQPKVEPPVTLKPPFQTPRFVEALAEFEAHRREMRKTLQTTGRKRLYEKLSIFGEADAVLALHDAVANGWTGVYRPKAEIHRNGNGATNERPIWMASGK